MLQVTERLGIAEDVLDERFVRASGPGGQHVNKVSTAVELRFDVRRCQELGEQVKSRLTRLAGRRMNKEGVIVVRADRFRSQELNRSDARDRLVRLVREALVRARPRIATKPSRAAVSRRLDAKSRRSSVKNMRRARPDFD